MPKAGKPASPVIVRNEVLARLGGDAAFLEELLDLYGSEFEKYAADLETALARKDFPSLREIGHTLKGASANLSLPSLQAAALDAERAGRDGDAPRGRAAVAALRKEFARFLAARKPPRA